MKLSTILLIIFIAGIVVLGASINAFDDACLRGRATC